MVDWEQGRSADCLDSIVFSFIDYLLIGPLFQQKMAFIDVAKGIRMFAKLVVPCVAVVENMSYFDADGKRYFPFGQGSGERIQRDFGLPNLIKFPIVADLSAAGDGEPLSSLSSNPIYIQCLVLDLFVEKLN